MVFVSGSGLERRDLPATVSDEDGEHEQDHVDADPAELAAHRVEARGEDHDQRQSQSGPDRQPRLDPGQRRQDEADPAEQFDDADEANERRRVVVAGG